MLALRFGADNHREDRQRLITAGMRRAYYYGWLHSLRHIVTAYRSATT